MPGDASQSDTSPDLHVLRSACEESRVVLDHQLAVLSDIDDKAIWSVRTAILVLGLVLSAVSLTGHRSVQSLQMEVLILSAAGAMSLVTTIWVGMITYHWSFEEFGVGSDERASVFSKSANERQWRMELLALGYSTWIERQETFNQYNQWLLLATHFVLSLGVTLLLAAGGLYLIGP